MSPQKSVLVTGASTGIGRETARLAATQGWSVFAGVRKEADAEAIRAEGLPNLRPILVDITQGSMIEAAIGEIDARVGAEGLHALVNNAGIARGGPVEFTDLSHWREQLETNIIGTIEMTRHALPLLRKSQNARIVNVGSIVGLVSVPFIAPYAASKHAIDAITASQRIELAPWNIHATVIAPGSVNTPIWDKAERDSTDLLERLSPLARDRYGKQLESMTSYGLTTGRKGTSPEQVAKVICKALKTPKPRQRYLVGSDAKMLNRLSQILPAGTLEWVLRRHYGV